MVKRSTRKTSPYNRFIKSYFKKHKHSNMKSAAAAWRSKGHTKRPTKHTTKRHYKRRSGHRGRGTMANWRGGGTMANWRGGGSMRGAGVNLGPLGSSVSATPTNPGSALFGTMAMAGTT